jgi:ABC-2 type transport system permease protein
MRLYAAVAWRGFRRYSTYRAATAAGAFTNTVFGFIMAYTYIALWEARPGLGGYDIAEALTFVFLGQSLMAAMALFGGGFSDDLAERIRNGDVAIDLYRPVDMQAWWLAMDTGRAGFQFLARGIPPTIVGALVFPVALPTNPLTWLAFLGAVLLGLLVSYAIRYIVTLFAFWLLDLRGVNALAALLGGFLSGMFLPLTLFPGALADVALRLPWACVLQVPVDVLLGKHQGADLLLAYGLQAGWAVALLLLGRVLTAVATTRVVVQGG